MINVTAYSEEISFYFLKKNMNSIMQSNIFSADSLKIFISYNVQAFLVPLQSYLIIIVIKV